MTVVFVTYFLRQTQQQQRRENFADYLRAKKNDCCPVESQSTRATRSNADCVGLPCLDAAKRLVGRQYDVPQV